MATYPAIYLATFAAYSGGVSSGQFYAHSIHSHPLTQPYIVTRVNDYASDTLAGAAMATNVSAARSALISTYTSAGKSFLYTIHWQNAGQTSDGVTPYSNTDALVKHTTDKVVTVPAINGYSTPFTVTGRTALASRMTTAINKFKTDLTAGGIESPVESLSDFEDNMRADLACASGTHGWLAPTIADGRYASEVVDGTNTFSTLFSAKVDIGGSGFTYDDTQDMYNVAANYKLFSWVTGLRSKVTDYAHDIAVRAPMRSAFSGISCGVYNICASTSAHPQPGDKAYLSDYTTGSLRHDIQCPVLYPLGATAFTNTQSSYSDQCTRYSVTYTGVPATDERNLFIARAIKMMTEAFAAAPSKPVVPWIPKPGYVEVGGNYTVTWQDLYTIMAAGRSLGVTRWILFIPDPTTQQLTDALSLINQYQPQFLQRPSMHRNLSIVRSFLANAASNRIDIAGVWDSNGMKDGAGWDDAMEYAVRQLGYQSYATPLFGAGENSVVTGTTGATGLGAGVGYGTTASYGGDSASTDYVSYKANSNMSTVYVDPVFSYRNGSAAPPADLLQWMDTTACGNWAPLAPLFKPLATDTVKWWSNPVGMRLGGGTANPIDTTAALRAEVWIGQPSSGTTSSDATESRWLKSTSIGGGLSNIAVNPVIALRTDLGPTGTMVRQTHDKAADATHVDLEWRTPVGGTGAGTWWFKTYFRVFNTTRTNGIAVTPLYAAGSQSTYDMANGLINFPDKSFQHFFEALTYNQPTTRRVMFHVCIGPNDLSETDKLAGAPAGTGSSVDVVKYNVQQIISRIKAGWAYTNTNTTLGGTFLPQNIIFLLQVHVPQTGSNESTFVQYRSAMNDICDADTTHVAHVDTSFLTTYAQLSNTAPFTGNPVFDSSGTDVNHLGNRTSYRLIMQSVLSTVLNSAGVDGRVSRVIRTGRISR